MNRTFITIDLTKESLYQSCSAIIYESIPKEFFKDIFKIDKNVLEMRVDEIEKYTHNVNTKLSSLLKSAD